MSLWRLEFERSALRALKKCDPPVRRQIAKALDGLGELEDPAARCKPLTGPLAGLWRLRVGDYRVLLDIQRGRMVIIALDMDHRSRIYDR